MDLNFGYTQAEWDAAKNEMRLILIRRAKLRGTIPYSEVTSQIHSIVLEPHSPAMAAILGEISEEEDTAGHGMLSVVVVHKEGDMQPGPGFFELAKDLGRDTADILRCWIEELKKVHKYWSVH
jgi:hypothetical protein